MDRNLEQEMSGENHFLCNAPQQLIQFLVNNIHPIALI